MKGERGCDPSWQTISRKLMEIYFVIIKPILRPRLSRNYPLLLDDKMPDEEVPVFVVEQKPAFHLSLYCKCFKRENLFKTFTTNSVKKANKIYKYKVFYN